MLQHILDAINGIAMEVYIFEITLLIIEFNVTFYFALDLEYE